MSSLVRRHAAPRAQEWLDTFPALIVEGARQVGKSTFAEMVTATRHARLFTLDDEEVRATAQRDPRGFVDQIPDGTLVIDEIQRVPELILPIKASIDQDRRPGRFLLTGSSDLLRLEQTPDSLAGRAVTIPLRGFSQGEVVGAHDDFLRTIANSDFDPWDFSTSLVRDDYIAILARGAFPDARRISERARRAWLDRYLQSIVQRDILDLNRPVDPARLESVLRLIAANQSGELVKARLADQAQVPASSIATYLDLVQTLFLVESLRPWTPNLTRREIGRTKASITDSALAMRLARVTPGALEPLVGSEYLGLLLEGLVTSELRKQATWTECDYELYHYRDRDRVEVDVIVELDDGRIIGIEVKANRTYKPEHFKGLEALANKLGDRFALGIVLGTSDRGYKYGQNLWGLPISALWEATS